MLPDGLIDGENYSEVLNTDKIFIAGGSKLYNSTFHIVGDLK